MALTLDGATDTEASKSTLITLPSKKDSYNKEELDNLCHYISSLGDDEVLNLNKYDKGSLFSIDTLKLMSGYLGLPKNRKKEDLIKQIRDKKNDQNIVRLVMETQSKSSYRKNKNTPFTVINHLIGGDDVDYVLVAELTATRSQIQNRLIRESRTKVNFDP